tara:strand:- start:33968 stop:34951 length:984 start_codon:yes stop_codon:yes gene_type:complete
MNKEKPLVSVIVPTRNRVELLRGCLEGISVQDYSLFEVIIIDDGSDEDVITAYETMLEEFGERFKLFRSNLDSRRRMGPSVARNIGISHASGEIIAFCDDDDFWCSADLLSVAVDALGRNDAELYFSDQQILRDGQIVSKTSFKNVKARLTGAQLLNESQVYALTRKQILCFPDYAHLNVTVAQAALLERTLGFWEETRYAEDVDLFVRLCDRANGILFRDKVCSSHNAPQRNAQDSASQGVSQLNRRLLENSVYSHLAAVCRSKEARRYAALSLASSSKLISQQLEQQNQLSQAALFARLALGVRPGLKWGLYTLWLSSKAIFKGG